MKTDLWKRKLTAFLHDPPEKAYDFTHEHERSAETYMHSFKLSPEEWQNSRQPDWTSSAADRFCFPSAKRVSEKTISFIHPLSGSVLYEPNVFPPAEKAIQWIHDVLPVFSAEMGDQERFWLVWRLWLEFAAEHATGQHQGSDTLPYLPADTRIPDHSIWHHMSVTSAMEAMRDDAGSLRPAFLLFQLGPVQDFIAQARSTRDLWSGSYLIAWLMAHALQAVAEQVGPDAVIFPSLRAQPLFDWINKDKLQKAGYKGSSSYWSHLNQKRFHESVLTPTLPNRFLAIVPEDFSTASVVQSLETEWARISKVCKEWLAKKGCPIPCPDRWENQIRRQWEATWQIWPWTAIDETLALWKRIESQDAARVIDRSKAIADQARKDQGYPLNDGWTWSGQYKLCCHRLDGRRQTRAFEAWQGVDRVVKDDYSGREEEVTDEKWREHAQQTDLGFLFRKEEEHLGAANLIKRIWHKAYLAEEQKLHRASESFDSVPAVAAHPWRTRVLPKFREAQEAWSVFVDFQKKVGACWDRLECPLPSNTQESEWMDKIDASVFYESFWNNLKQSDTARLLKRLFQEAGVGKPSSYYAVLALDGDDMGRWVGGENTPPIRSLLCPSAIAYFEKQQDGNDWLNGHRPISPAYHLQFSEALAHFGLYCARRIVEAHYGKLIFAGGDDVLAMLPAEEAIACARGLHAAFRGESYVSEQYPDLFQPSAEGTVCLKQGSPSWPLLVPGPLTTASVGLSIGHIHEPLQDMVDAARKAERRAKKIPGKDALSISLFKRSGEQIEWETKFIPEPFNLLSFMDKEYRPPHDDPKKKMPISGKFPYRICELLRKYEPDESMSNWKEVARAEVDWAINQMKKHEALKVLRERIFQWLEKAPKLSEFYNLFAVEAFIARQGEE